MPTPRSGIADAVAMASGDLETRARPWDRMIPAARPLRILQCTALPSGGAGRLAQVLHHTCLRRGIDSTMLVTQGCPTTDYEAPRGWIGGLRRRLAPTLDQFPLRFYRDRDGRDFTPGWFGSWFTGHGRRRRPDLVHLHWCGAGSFRIERLPDFAVPIIWTMHDRWVFTGGCHFPGACQRYLTGCGCCPALGSKRPHDLSARIFARKAAAYSRCVFTPVALSEEAAAQATATPLLRDHPSRIIPNGIDVFRFRPGDRVLCRAEFGIGPGAVVLGFGAINAWRDPRKGADLLLAALRLLPADPPVVLLSFGGVAATTSLPATVRCHDFGVVDDDQRLCRLYNACDVFVLPSREEGLPTTALEAQACGTPVAAFAIDGCRAAVADGITGHLAEPFDPAALARAITACIADRSRLTHAARVHAVRQFSMERMVDDYLDLYAELTGWQIAPGEMTPATFRSA
jgi:glycosyltransferase involved in cell wall biosynthesis